MPTAWLSLKSASVRGSSVPSRTVATCPSRIAWPLRSATTTLAKSSGVSSRPFRRMVCSSSFPVMRPTGAARFCAWSACTTCSTLNPAAWSAAGLSSTVSSRSMPPTTVTCATPGTERSSRTTVGSAMRESCVAGSVSEVSVSETMGMSAGSNRVRMGSSISFGRSARLLEMASRMSCEACWMSFS